MSVVSRVVPSIVTFPIPSVLGLQQAQIGTIKFYHFYYRCQHLIIYVRIHNANVQNWGQYNNVLTKVVITVLKYFLMIRSP